MIRGEQAYTAAFIPSIQPYIKIPNPIRDIILTKSHCKTFLYCQVMYDEQMEASVMFTSLINSFINCT